MRVAIIGAGGAGLLAAWLLEERHDVTLFERETRLGGHARSVEVADGRGSIPVSTGLHFFSRRMYPRFIALLEHLRLPLIEYEQTLTFVDRRNGRTLCLPPTGRAARYATLLGKGALSTLLALNKTLAAADPLVAGGDWSLTFGDFIGRLDLPRAFTDDFLLPFFGSNWGVMTDEIAAFSARAVLSYATRHRPRRMRPCLWTEVDGGIERYAEVLGRAAARTRFVRGGDVVAIARDGEAWRVQTGEAALGPFDHVVFATNAQIAARAIGGVAGAEPLREILERFEYFDTRITVHRDTSFLAADRRRWSVVNLARERDFCAIHHWAGWRHDADVFRSWTTHYQKRPRDVLAELVYEHGKPTPAYYAAQRRLAAIQGEGNLWLCGVYTQGFDNHESALRSAIDAARSIGAGARIELFEDCDPGDSRSGGQDTGT